MPIASNKKTREIYEKILPSMLSPYAMPLLKAIPVSSEIMYDVYDYFSKLGFDLERLKKDIQKPYEEKDGFADFTKRKSDYLGAAAIYIEKSTMFNKPYSINFRRVVNEMNNDKRTEKTYKLDHQTGTIHQHTEEAYISRSTNSTLKKAISDIEYTPDGVMMNSHTKEFRNENRYSSQVKEGEFIPTEGYGKLTDEEIRFRDERCPYLMHVIGRSGKESVRLIDLSELTSLNEQTDDKTLSMYRRLLYSQLGRNAYRANNIDSINCLEGLTPYLENGSLLHIRTSFENIDEAMDYLNDPSVNKLLNTMLNHQYLDEYEEKCYKQRDNDYGIFNHGAYKKAFESLLRLQNRSSEKIVHDNTDRMSKPSELSEPGD